MKSFDSGKQTAKKERNVSPWAKPLIKEMVVALPIGDNRHERYPEPRQGGERKPSPWGKLLPKEKTSVAEAAGKQCQVNNKPERQEKIRQIKDRLSSLGAVKERAGSERSERAGSHKAESLGKDSDGRVQLEMSYAQFLHFIERGREQEEKALLLKEEQHPVLEAMDMVFDFIAWLIGLFLSPILEEDDEKETKKDLKKEEDEWYRRRYEKSLRKAFQTEKEDDSVGMKINWYGSKTHEQGAGTAAAIAIHERAALLHLISNTIAQFARAAGFSFYHAAEVLRGLDRWGLVGWFGFVGIPGQGKAPKVFYLRRKGFDVLCSENPLFADPMEPFSDVQAAWTPHMYHRLRIIDLLISAEVAMSNRPHLRMVKVFVEYRMRRRGTSPARETTDFVNSEEISENKLVPDAVFILENIETERRALFFVEMDMGSERIISHLPRDQKITLHYKLAQYDRYLKSLRYSETYREYGQFRSFILLFVTLSSERMDNIIRHVQDLPVELSPYYRFTTFQEAMGDLFGPIWKSRSLADRQLYSLVRDKPAQT